MAGVLVVGEEVAQGVDGVVVDAVFEGQLAGCGGAVVGAVVALQRLDQAAAVGRDHERTAAVAGADGPADQPAHHVPLLLVAGPDPVHGQERRAAQVVGKLVKSAASNAEANLGVPRDSLKVSGCFADAGPTLKRIHPRAMGRAYRIIKRTSHITVMVEETEPKPSTRKLARTVGRGDARGRRRGKPEAAGKPARGAKTAPAGPKEEVKEEAAGQTAAVEEEAPLAAGSAPEASEAPAAEEPGAEASKETGGEEPAQKGDE
mgnify:CR=1 FL=1